MPLLEVTDLRTWFHTRGGVYRAVDGVSFAVERGETLGIVGESGSGKSVTCYSLMGLVPQPPGRIESGRAVFDGTDLLRCSPAEARAIRGKRIAMIFQDPMTSLNPYLRISEQLIEPLLIHERISRADALARGRAMLEAVGIPDPGRRLDQYPHEFSGGMRQRIAIAIAMVNNPKILIADGNYPASTKKGPNASLVCLNLSPGLVTVAQVLEAILSAVPVDQVQVMGIPADDPYAALGEPPVWGEFRRVLAAAGSSQPLEPILKWDFYRHVESPDHVMTVQTGDRALWANVLLTLGCRTD